MLGADYVLAWLIELSIVFSYTGSWAIYASDFSRYLPARIRLPRMFAYAFAGTFASTSWMMVLGAALFTLTPGVDDVLAGFRLVLPGGVLQIVLVTFIVGALAHNAVNLYSGALAGLTCDLPVGRSISVVVLGVLGGVIAAAFGGSGFLANLELFLLLVSYFVMPWLGVLLVDFYWAHRAGTRYEIAAFYERTGPLRGTRWRAMLAFVTGIAVSVPFMATDAYTGPLGRSLHGADLSYFVSFLVALLTYRLALTGWRQRPSAGSSPRS